MPLGAMSLSSATADRLVSSLFKGNLLIEPRQASTVMPMISSSRSAQARAERGFGRARSSRARHFAVSHHVAASTADNSRPARSTG